jgi:hypothetical protein
VVLVAVLYPLALRSGRTFESIRRLQVTYRALYAFIGLMMTVNVFLAAAGI